MHSVDIEIFHRISKKFDLMIIVEEKLGGKKKKSYVTKVSSLHSSRTMNFRAIYQMVNEIFQPGSKWGFKRH